MPDKRTSSGEDAGASRKDVDPEAPAAGTEREADPDTATPGAFFPPDDPNDPRLKIPDILTRPVERGARTDGKKRVSDFADMGRAWSTALDFIFSILACGGLGWLSDKWKFTSAPTGVLIGLSVGFVVAFYRIVRATHAQERAEREKRK